MSARPRAVGWLALSALCVIAGCYGTDICTRERCDGIDNDCDETIDEGFRDELGRYTGLENCGDCGVICADVYPDAEEVECSLREEVPRCEITACPEGERVVGQGTCAEAPDVQCLPCITDSDCTKWAENSKCAGVGSSGGKRCLQACPADGCGEDYVCNTDANGSLCAPKTGTCSCSASSPSALACLLFNPQGAACIGSQSCDGNGLGSCQPALAEVCNTADDDCDGKIDEGFVDERGRYVLASDCGSCGSQCLASGPNMLATCELANDTPSCQTRCADGYVDVDKLRVTGCECRLAQNDEVVIGQDGDCDGAIDPTPELIFVTPSGDDANDGGDVKRAVSTLTRGIELGVATGRAVLIARGIYQGPVAVQTGMRVYGGYSPDFRERDVVLNPVVIEAPQGANGVPVLTCDGLNAPTRAEADATTRLDGVTIAGSDASAPGEGSTTVYLNGCGGALALSNITIFAGRGASGTRGEDSSSRLDEIGFDSLLQLSGEDGGDGGDGGFEDAACVAVDAGNGGAKLCPSGDVSGGAGGDSLCADLSQLCANGSGVPCGNAGCTDFTDGNGVCDLEAAKDVAIINPTADDGAGPGAGRAGEPAYASVTNRGVCSFCDDNPSLPRIGASGEDGESGDDGGAGLGCGSEELLDVASGLLSAQSGSDGESGSDGSGGGGATAGSGYSVIGNTPSDGSGDSCGNVAGGSGGGGGSGGCGAPGASHGTGGGTSVGIVIIAAAPNDGPVLDDVRIVTASGGDGGDGGIGAAGGGGGAGGIGGGSHFFCARSGGRGGDGGNGGAGGGGGGGCGGGSYGVYVSGASDGYVALLEQGARIEAAGVPGRGGFGGFSPGQSGTDGGSGVIAGIFVAP